MAKAKKGKVHPKNKWIIVRNSPVHGFGCFARRDIPKGTRMIEYFGERISPRKPTSAMKARTSTTTTPSCSSRTSAR